MDSFIGEIRILPYAFAPYEWAWCNGQQVPIQQQTTLFSLIGTLYGGNGTTTFNLPNLASSPGNPGAAPMGQGTGTGLTPRDVGEAPGAPTVSLLSSEMPLHNHTFTGQSTGTNTDRLGTPTNAWLGRGYVGGSAPEGFDTYVPYAAANQVAFRNPALSTYGQSVGHPNMQPYLPMNFCISLAGIYPQRP